MKTITLCTLPLALLFLLANHLLASNGTDVFIAIPITGTRLHALQKNIVEIQQKVKKSAHEHGYLFNTDIMPESDLHITLENITATETEHADTYKKCVCSVANSTTSFDMANQLQCARLALMGKDKDWCVLHLPADGKTPLAQLVQRIRCSMKQEDLPVGRFSKFRAHVSLGKFVKDKDHDKPTDLKWAPCCKVTTNDETCKVRKIMFSTRQRVKDASTGRITYQPNTPATLLFKNEECTPEPPKSAGYATSSQNH